MNDEATVHYNSVIDQMTWGHRRLNDTFGKCGLSRVAWQIDPFGHSQEQASLFAQMFIDGLFVGRVDWEDKRKREQEKKMEFVWQSNQGLGRSSDLFTGVLPNGYGPPGGFCFDDTCGDSPIVDDPSSEEYNVDAKVNDFLNQANDQAKRFATNHIIMTMGSDFQFQNAVMWFKNLDLLIKYVNQRGSNVNVFYSTPSCYLKALNEANVTWSTKTDDLFPYSSDPHAYWTGYFTSRPALKRFERVSNNWLQACKQLQVLSRIHEGDDLSLFKESMGINQHHDAVSGTEKQHVASDYALQLNKGLLKCYKVIEKSYAQLLPSKPDAQVPKQHFCPGLNISECSFTETEDNIAVTVYNPRAYEKETLVRLPWTSDVGSLFDDTGKPVASLISDVMETVKRLPERNSSATKEISFRVQLPALGFVTYFASKKPSSLTKRLLPMVVTREGQPVEFKAKSFSAFFDPVSGSLLKVALNDSTVVKVKQEFVWYEGMRGDNSKDSKRASGAYVFRPNGTTPHPFDYKNVKATFHTSDSVSEVHQVVNPWISQVVRVDKNDDSVEFDWVVGPVPTDDSVAKEIISKFTTDLKTRSVFYTDANGRQVLKRTRNFRPTWKLNVTEPVAGNYYPVNSRIMLKDSEKDVQVTVLSDRSQGGSSLVDGSLELMIHRRLLDDDGFGVGEALKEPGFDGKGLIVRGKHLLLVNKLSSESFYHRSKAVDLYLEPVLTFSDFDTVQKYRDQYKTRWSAMARLLPENVHILTLEEWKDKAVLLRVEHIYDQNDDPNNLSKPVTFSLTSLFKPFGIAHARETTLSANQWLSQAKRLSWKTNMGTNSEVNQKDPEPSPENDFNVTLKPLQIRTFILRLNDRVELSNKIPIELS